MPEFQGDCVGARTTSKDFRYAASTGEKEAPKRRLRGESSTCDRHLSIHIGAYDRRRSCFRCEYGKLGNRPVRRSNAIRGSEWGRRRGVAEWLRANPKSIHRLVIRRRLLFHRRRLLCLRIAIYHWLKRQAHVDYSAEHDNDATNSRLRQQTEGGSFQVLRCVVQPSIDCERLAIPRAILDLKMHLARQAWLFQLESVLARMPVR